MNFFIGILILYFLYHMITSLFTKIREGFNAPGGSPCDQNDDCESQTCEEKEGIKMCGETQVMMSAGQ